MSLSKEQSIALEKAILQSRNPFRSESLNMSFGEIISLYSNSDLIFRSFERTFHWNIDQRTKFIESLLLEIPIPSIFVAEDSDSGKWELVDGLQRVSTVLSFLGQLRESDLDAISSDQTGNTSSLNNWRMTEGEILKELDGLSWDDLPSKLYFMIKRSICPIQLIQPNLNHDIYHQLFNRLNMN